MPAYNVEKFIAKSIVSVLKQTFPDFELLIVIDDSPDQSKKVASLFKDERITIYSKPHSGLSDTRNFGLSRANGEFIYFMDPDDWIESDLLEDNLRILEQEELDFIVFGYVQEYENKAGLVEETRKMLPGVDAFVRGSSDPRIDSHHLEMLGYAWNKIYRRSFLEKHQILFKKGISLVEDILFNAAVFRASTIIRFNPSYYYHYINRDRASLINTYRENTFDLIKMKIRALAGFADEWELDYRDKLLGTGIVHGINYCIYNLYKCKNQLSSIEKDRLIKEILSDKNTISLIRYFEAENFRDKLYKGFIEKKKVDMVRRLALQY